MNREDIMRMACEANLMPLLDEDCFQNMGAKNFEATKRVLEHFAQLVAAAEREACAAICDRFQARDVGMQPAECAAAIRARGESK